MILYNMRACEFHAERKGDHIEVTVIFTDDPNSNTDMDDVGNAIKTLRKNFDE